MFDTGDKPEEAEDEAFINNLEQLKGAEIYKKITNQIYTIMLDKDYKHLFNEEEFNNAINSIENKHVGYRVSINQLKGNHYNILNQFQLLKREHHETRIKYEEWFYKNNLTNSEKERLQDVLRNHDSIIAKDFYKIEVVLDKLHDFLKNY